MSWIGAAAVALRIMRMMSNEIVQTKPEWGRPPTLCTDPDSVDRILDAIREGNTISIAAESGGVSRRTVHQWLQNARMAVVAREEDPEAEITPYDDHYIDFLIEFQKAQAEMKKKLLQRIIEAGEKQWTANAWVLERLFPEEFSSKREVKLRSDVRERRKVSISIGAPPDEARLAPPKEQEIQEADYEIEDE